MALTLRIRELVTLRLPFIDLEQASWATFIDSSIYEVMYMLQKCLAKTAEEVEREESYAPMERSLIADIVAIQTLSRRAAQASDALYNFLSKAGESSQSSGTGSLFLKKAQAGSSLVEYDAIYAQDAFQEAFKTSSAGSSAVAPFSSTQDLIRNNARTLAEQLGCDLPILYPEDTSYRGVVPIMSLGCNC